MWWKHFPIHPPTRRTTSLTRLHPRFGKKAALGNLYKEQIRDRRNGEKHKEGPRKSRKPEQAQSLSFLPITDVSSESINYPLSQTQRSLKMKLPCNGLHRQDVGYNPRQLSSTSNVSLSGSHFFQGFGMSATEAMSY